MQDWETVGSAIGSVVTEGVPFPGAFGRYAVLEVDGAALSRELHIEVAFDELYLPGGDERRKY